MVPKFYFAGGKPLSTAESKLQEEAINKVFDKGPISDLKMLCSQVLKIPVIFKEMLAARIKKSHPVAF